jgi:hypothetical protein
MRHKLPLFDDTARTDAEASYILAVWVMSAMASESTPAEALFGIALPISDGNSSDGPPAHGGRARWALDSDAAGPTFSCPSANSMHFNYSAVSRYLPRIWHNPWAPHPVNQDLPLAASRVSLDETSITNEPPTASASALFDLPADWPGEPFAWLNRRRAAS